jgi:hypothetical protein
MDPSGMQQRIEAIVLRFNEPVIPEDRLRRWLDQFPEKDRSAALTLLERVTFHTYPHLIRETRLLHTRIQEQLAADGFDSRSFSDVDFSREFTCKSGDIISYIYRKANAIPSVDFKNFDLLVSMSAVSPRQFSDRALVILDDYTGTGSQFIFQFIARNDADIRIINSYKRVYLASVVIHENAIEKLGLLQKGECRQVLSIEKAQFPDYDWAWEEKDLSEALCRVDWSRIGFLWVERERSLLSPENTDLREGERELLSRFLAKYGGDSTLSTSYLAGHHAFFYGAPNSLSKILLPLFSRIEDVSIYPTEHFIGISPGIIRWDMNERPASGR